MKHGLSSSPDEARGSAHADHKTVGKVRTELEATGDIPQLTETVGGDGKSRKKPIHWQKRVHPEVAYPAANRGVTARTIIEEREGNPGSDADASADELDVPENPENFMIALLARLEEAHRMSKEADYLAKAMVGDPERFKRAFKKTSPEQLFKAARLVSEGWSEVAKTIAPPEQTKAAAA